MSPIVLALLTSLQAHLHGSVRDRDALHIRYQYDIPSGILRCVLSIQTSRVKSITNPVVVDLTFVLSSRFAWKVAVIVAISAFPLYIIKFIRSRVAPAASSKLL